MKGQTGFTLVEALVTGLVSTLAAGVILTVFMMNNNQIREGSDSLRKSQIHDVVSRDIRRKVMISDRVMTLEEYLAGPIAPNPPPSAALTSQRSLVCMSGNTVTCAYRTDGPEGYLKEMDPNALPAVTFIPYRIGSDTVWMTAGATGFTLLANRNGVLFDMRVQLVKDGEYLTPQEEMVLCRNANRM
jgi:hypothetical protein